MFHSSILFETITRAGTDVAGTCRYGWSRDSPWFEYAYVFVKFAPWWVADPWGGFRKALCYFCGNMVVFGNYSSYHSCLPAAYHQGAFIKLIVGIICCLFNPRQTFVVLSHKLDKESVKLFLHVVVFRVAYQACDRPCQQCRKNAPAFTNGFDIPWW